MAEPRRPDLEARFGALVAAIVGRSARWPWLVVAAALVVSAALAVYVARRVAIDTDTTDMLSRELQFRRDYEAYKAAFPESDALVVVIEGDNPDRVEDAAEALAAALRRDRGRFLSVLYPEGERFFAQNGLLYLSLDELQAMGQRLAAAQPLLATLGRDPSLRGFFDVLGLAAGALGTADGNAAEIAPVLDRVAAVVAARAAGKPAPLSWKALMSPEATAALDRRRLIVVQPLLDHASLAPAAAAMDEVRRLARALGFGPESGVRVRLTGAAAIDSEEIASVAANTEISGLISTVAVGLLLVMCFRAAWLVVASLVMVFVGLIWTAAFAVFAIGSFNLISVAFAVLFIGIGVDFAIHFTLRYRERVEAGEAGRAGLAPAGRSIGASLGLAAVSAAVAFFSFLPTDYRGVSELGLIAGVGMILAFLTAITVLPALLALWPLKRAAPAQPGATLRRLERAEAAIATHARPILAAALALGVVALALLAFMRFDRNPLNLKDPAAESVATAVELMKDPRVRVGTIAIAANSMEDAAALAPKLRALPSVEAVLSVLDYVPADQPAKLDAIEEMSLPLTPILRPGATRPPPDAAERRAAFEKFRAGLKDASGRAGAAAPAVARLVAALDAFAAGGLDDSRLAALEADLVGGLPKRLDALRLALSAKPVTFADLPESLRQREISPTGRVRLEVVPKRDLRDNRELRRFVTEVTALVPNATGGPVIELRAGDAILEAFATASGLALVLIVVMLAVILRNAADVLLMLAPLALAGALTGGISVAAGISFNYANIIVLPLLLGLGVASGIYLVLRARKESGLAMLKTTTPRAVLYSALTTIASFASLAISPHWGTASMGLLLFIAIAVNLLCYLVMLPALLAYVGQRRAARAQSSEAS